MLRSLLVDITPLRRSASFRSLFLARFVLLFGVGLVAVTVPLEVYRLTGSTATVSLVAAAEGFAFFAGFLAGGVLADRRDRWALIVWSTLVCGLTFVGLTLNAAFLQAVWPVFAFVVLNGLSGSMGITALLAVLPELVDASQLHAVGALNTVSMRLGTVLAPVTGGAVFAVAGPGWNYGVGAVTALSAWVVLLLVARRRAAVPRSGTQAAPSTAEGPLRAMRSGYRFVVREPVVRGVMVAGVVGMCGGGSLVLIPAFVDARLGGDPTVVGLMYSALSAGLILGALGSGRLGGVSRPGRLLLAMMIVSFLCYVAAGLASVVPVVLLLVVAAGASVSVEEVLRYALLQIRTPAAMLGRVNSVFGAQNMSGAAVGALVAGVFGSVFGPADAFWVYNAVMAGVGVVLLVALPGLRRVGGHGRVEVS
ncbi:enterobactin transporter EntS [Pseudonocardia oroxyli]|uniref:MFS transporter, ENTS family, enterobactin (Siderophore) exporter n=1 Tax=Pseudonocardia oroxyli TaxID=366584 RepID=A0A1G8DS56_PSEOR|nr:enterobactin transporter EntS [Pseudonocardia oroxyli]SDH60425.1 MFS transporter, ENTS family, enterobactin (siderophore) exporter [Pseudonocardia oroxyli]